MTETATQPPPAPAAEELHCPLCDYNLRGLEEPRCPECGYSFTWDELNSPERRLHPYLFEHHPERNLWSFRRTLLGGLRPGRFWRTLFPTQPSRPRRLAVYGIVVSCAWLLVLLPQVVRSIAAVDADQVTRQAVLVTNFPRMSAAARDATLKRFGSPQAWAAVVEPRWPHPMLWTRAARARLLDVTLFAAILWLAWPWLTLGGLMIFQVSMRRARVCPVHVLRCVVYTGDVSLWMAAFMFALILIDVAAEGPVGRASGRGPGGSVILASAVLLAVATYRLGTAYRDYLRFDHPFATAAAVQLMVTLLAYKGVLDWVN